MTSVIRGQVALWTRLLFTFSIAGLLAGTSSTALAAFGELDITFPYVPLGDAGHAISGVSGVQHGLGNVKLNGWTFPFAKTTFNEVMVSTDGFLTVGSGKQVCGCTASLGADTGELQRGAGPTDTMNTSSGTPAATSHPPSWSSPFRPSIPSSRRASSCPSTTTMRTLSLSSRLRSAPSATCRGGGRANDYLIVD